MTFDKWIALAQLLANIGSIIGGVILFLIGIGMKFGRLERGRDRDEGRKPPSIRPAEDGPTNGEPSRGELARRVQALENDRRQYLRSGEFTEFKDANRNEHEAMRSDIKRLEVMDNVQQRRIDALIGQG